MWQLKDEYQSASHLQNCWIQGSKDTKKHSDGNMFLQHWYLGVSTCCFLVRFYSGKKCQIFLIFLEISLMKSHFFLWISLVRNFFRKGPGDLDIKFASQVCQVFSLSFWVVVSNIFHFHPHLGKWSNVTNIFRMGWNQQLGLIGIVIEMGSLGNPRRIFGDGCQ